MAAAVAAAAVAEAAGRAVAAGEGAIPAEIRADDGTSLDHKELFDRPAQAGLSFGGELDQAAATLYGSEPPHGRLT